MTSRLLSSAALLLAAGVAVAEDWPQWGGPTLARDMYARATGLPDHLDPGKFKPGTSDTQLDLATTKNVVWAVKLGTQSYGNVTVAGGRVFVGTNNESPRDPRYQGDRSLLMCFDEKSGKLLWQQVIPKLKSGKVNDWEGLGLLSSPTVEGNRVYYVSSRCEVLCEDVEGMANGNEGPYKDEAKYVVLDTGLPPVTQGPTDGDIIWRYDMIDELGVFPHNASNCSVLIVGDILYSCTSNGQDWTHSNVPSPLSPSLIALDKRTGAYLGEDDAHIGPRIFHGQWSSPSAGVVNGKTLIFFGGGDGFCYAFNPIPVKEGDSSLLKKVWWFDCNPPQYRVRDGKPVRYPSAEGPSEVNATPVFYKNRVYVAIGQDPEHGEGVGNLTCIDATQTGDVTHTAKLWSYDKIHRSLSTVSIDPDNGLLFVGDFSGFLHCLDAETGQLYWTHDLKSHIWGSTMVADGKVYVGDEDGDLYIFADSKEKKLLSQASFSEPIYATPVVANGMLFLQTNAHLYAFKDLARANGPADQPPTLNLK